MNQICRRYGLGMSLAVLLAAACSAPPSEQCGSVTSAASAGAANSSAGATNNAGAGTNAPINVLVFNYTTGFGHQSRETAIPLLRTAAENNGIHLELKYALSAVQPDGPSDASNIEAQPCAPRVDTSAFVPGGLDAYDAVFFLNTTGTPLAADGAEQELVHQRALQDYLESRHGGFVGTHSATDTYANWPFYVDMIGSAFQMHSLNGTLGTVTAVPGLSHPILTQSALPEPWSRADEWYAFKRDVGTLPGFTVLLRVDDAVYPERPAAWVHELPGGGRAFYTSMGHGVEAFQDPAVMRLLINGIKWAAHRL